MRATLTVDEPADDTEFQVPADVYARLVRLTWFLERTTAGNLAFTLRPTGKVYLESAVMYLQQGRAL